MIRALAREDLPEYAEVVRKSFATVATALNLTPENCRYHPAFVTNERLSEKYKKNYYPFGYFVNEKLAGFASLTHGSGGVFEMNDVTVLPEFRGKKIGKALVDFCKATVAEFGGKKIIIEVVLENAGLREWYAAQGFVFTRAEKLEHLTITFGYMEWVREGIRPLEKTAVPVCAEIIRQSFATVAEKFGFTAEQCPAHLGGRVEPLLAEKFREGYYPFGYFADGNQVGFVSLTDRTGGVFEMNNLAVLPEFRHFGYATALLDFCKEKALALGGEKIFIEIIHENKILEKWYAAHGFVHTKTHTEENLPFTVGHMEWAREFAEVKMSCKLKQKLIIITGSPCVGKTSVADRLFESYENSAHFDGDWAWRVNPFSISDPRLRNGDKTMSFALSTYLNSNFDYVVFSSIVVLGGQIREAILKDITAENYTVIAFTLKCSEETLIERHRKRGDDGEVDFQWLRQSPHIGDYVIDTDNKTVEEIAAEIKNIVDAETKILETDRLIIKAIAPINHFDKTLAV